MKVIKDLYAELAGKKVTIYVKRIGIGIEDKFVGTVVGCYSTGAPFLVLDTKELINIKYIATIKIMD